MLEYSPSGGLAEYAKRLEALGDKAFDEACEQCADAVKPLVEDEFAGGHDPSGRAWAATVRGNDPLIGDTLQLSTSVVATPTKTGFTIAVTDWKSVFHQGGTRRGIPARPMLPTDGRLPPTWEAAMEKIILAILQKYGGQQGGGG